MRSVNVSETRENLAQLLDAVEAGEEVVIMRRDRPVARLVPMDKPMAPFLHPSRLLNELPPIKTTAAQAVRALRDEERY
jgi:prevent-host-death family protein